MGLEALKDAIVAFTRDHIAMAAPVTFFLGFAEGIPGLSFFVPSSVLFLGIGAMHSAAGGSFWQVWLAAAGGAVLGDCATYALGRWFKQDIAQFGFLKRNPDWLPRGYAMFERWGVLAVVAGKFLGFLRPVIPIIAGIVDMPFGLFMFGSIVSSLAWAGVFLAPGYGIKWLAG